MLLFVVVDCCVLKDICFYFIWIVDKNERKIDRLFRGGKKREPHRTKHTNTLSEFQRAREYLTEYHRYTHTHRHKVVLSHAHIHTVLVCACAACSRFFSLSLLFSQLPLAYHSLSHWACHCHRSLSLWLVCNTLNKKHGGICTAAVGKVEKRRQQQQQQRQQQRRRREQNNKRQTARPPVLGRPQQQQPLTDSTNNFAIIFSSVK